VWEGDGEEFTVTRESLFHISRREAPRNLDNLIEQAAKAMKSALSS
jgi:hypothetical protein